MPSPAVRNEQMQSTQPIPHQSENALAIDPTQTQEVAERIVSALNPMHDAIYAGKAFEDRRIEVVNGHIVKSHEYIDTMELLHALKRKLKEGPLSEEVQGLLTQLKEKGIDLLEGDTVEDVQFTKDAIDDQVSDLQTKRGVLGTKIQQQFSDMQMVYNVLNAMLKAHDKFMELVMRNMRGA